MAASYLHILLHAHLPFIRHPEHENFLEESWLFEALSESYIPMIRAFRRLEAEQIPIRLTISFSPTLLSMLSDDLLKERYLAHLEKMIELGRREIDRTQREHPECNSLARMYHDFYCQTLDYYRDVLGGNICAAFLDLALKGHIELITTPGTYPFLPFYEHYPENIRAHLDASLSSFEAAFSRAPAGMWLPEAGYFQGLESFLKDHGLQFFYTSVHGVLFSPDVPKAGIYAPARLPNGMHAFGRDLSSAGLVWSPQTGYPKDGAYRDFYRDIGHDLPLEYIADFIHLGRIRVNTGYKYYAVTGDTNDKHLYDPHAAAARVQEHARHFVHHHRKHMSRVREYAKHPPVSTSPYAAELFGHWWMEGVQWLEAVLRLLPSLEGELETITPSQYLTKYHDHPKVQPIFSSWGNKGYAETWLDGRNDWIYRHLHMAIDRMVELTERFPDATGLKRRALNQAAREVLLSQSLDWPIIMRNGAAVSYASSRIKEHISNFYRIYDALGEGKLSTEWLTRIEKKNNLFPALNYLSFARRSKKR